jgi:pyridoxal phosphate enzyme (YggS family)
LVIASRLAALEERIHQTVIKAGRRREDVQLIAVSKTFPAEALEEAYRAGLRVFGENYIQEFESKKPQLRGMPDAEWHLIGHLQSNKARKAAELFQTVQTVDDLKLARRLNDTGTKLSVMIEVKLSGEDSKHGTAPENLAELAQAIRQLPNLTLTGLMTIPPWSQDPEMARPYFRRLRQLAESIQVPHLSMGMSNDFVTAIEEGATHIRIGTALFGSRVRKPPAAAENAG